MVTATAAVQLTPKQSEVFRAIEQYYAATGEACPITFLVKLLNVHHETIREHVAALFQKGVVLAPGSPVTPAAPVCAPRTLVRHLVYALLNVKARLVKIGFTVDLETTVRELQSCTGPQVVLLGAFDYGPGIAFAERQWHRRFGHARVTGDWFSLTPDLKAELEGRFGVTLPAK